MESNVQQQTTPKDLSGEAPGTMTTKPSLGDQPWQEWLTPVVDILAKVPEYVGQFFSEYKQPLTTLGLLLLAIISVKIIVAVLGAIDDIPLLAPLLQIVGLAYTAWFVWRYLWKASNRKELLAEFDALKNQMFGDNG
ncbi:CAAD domain-containing protein [Crocosphaera sp. UHCC 0190]|uniref:CAAD domain-containing protein n=1 Tax=Crocosphaera sp. UHCC 0190 TaxID=3110246 RepID=UPI002B217A63|nr:CAAD domain-containing protein [Crocosphaera sp. UHCC 0190]MEA5511393.1 CAAD domain-containing protein [Crocosphaera sp. UHCC 0190]